MRNDKASIRTTRSIVNHFGVARSGTQDVRLQRLTSIALLPLAIAFIWNVLALVGKDYAAARAYLHHPGPAILTLLFILAGVYHMKVGMQSIIDDYAHGAVVKEWLLVANVFFSVFVGVACIYAVVEMGFVAHP
ncbi:MAG: succinate dehydrogenase, hydrophobic membrane anchor protein [Beijerinckiaceae bacterium]